MAKNFRIHAKTRGDQSLAIQLFGDFDASSACELLHVLDQSAKNATKVAIDTDGLRMINRFGLSVTLPRIAKLANRRMDIEVTGCFSGVFQE